MANRLNGRRRDKLRVAHLTSVHPRKDVRIFRKECSSLAASGYEVHLVVADGLGDAEVGTVRIHDIGSSAGRLRRMSVQPLLMWRAARRLEADLYHLHDPELIPVGLMLLRGGARVVYDSHEDVPRAVLSKAWIRPSVRPLVARCFEAFEDFAAARISAVVGATPHIAKRFASSNPRSVAISNYALLDEMTGPSTLARDGRSICYVGMISRIRGAVEMLQALEHVDATLILAGPFEDAATEAELRRMPGWAKVDYRGVVAPADVSNIMARSAVGLVLFHPEPNHVDAQPNKLFEYMSCGLPVLASDFPLWRSLMSETGAGRCCDPRDPVAVAKAIEELLTDAAAARVMGERGSAAVRERYNWSREEEKLKALYAELLAS